MGNHASLLNDRDVTFLYVQKVDIYSGVEYLAEAYEQFLN